MNGNSRDDQDFYGNGRSRKTQDLAFAGYCHMNGLQIVKGERRNGREFLFVFDDPNGRWNSLKRQFANSEALRFDSSVRALKKMCNG